MPTRRILIVTPDISGARNLEARLAAFGCEVAGIVGSGEEAIGMVAEAEPDLVLMGTTLGAEMSGLEAAEELRRLHPVPIVFMIAEADRARLEQAGLAEQYGYVVTPFTDRELRVNIDLALCRHGASLEARALEDGFFATSIDMLCILGFNGFFRRLNPAWERTLGFTLKELMSRPFIEFVHPDDRERTLKQNAQVRSGGQALAFENRYLCKDGTHRWFLWNAAPNPAGPVICSVARDVTERKQAEEEREQLLRKLQAALAEVKTLRLILPVCSYCTRVRDDKNQWQSVETYIARHTNTRLSHGICPSCEKTELEPQFDEIGDN